MACRRERRSRQCRRVKEDVVRSTRIGAGAGDAPGERVSDWVPSRRYGERLAWSCRTKALVANRLHAGSGLFNRIEIVVSAAQAGSKRRGRGWSGREQGPGLTLAL